MLLVLLTTALSASAALPTDSVRLAAKPGAVRPDTALSTLPVPTIVAPEQPAPEVVIPIRPVATMAHAFARLMGEEAPRSVEGASSSPRAPEVVQQARMVVAATNAATPVAPSSPAIAPADAVATAAAGPRNVVTTTRVDPRTVVSVRSSERFEPLYAVPIPPAGLRVPAPSIADSIVVYKKERTLTLFYRGVPVKSYFVALGAKPVGDKERAGDHKTPEGLFHINAHNPASKYHLALRISYPDDAHRARAAALGVDPGGDIMIHGLPPEFSEAGKDHRQNDWTNGCVALSNPEIEELWRAVPDGTPVQIKP